MIISVLKGLIAFLIVSFLFWVAGVDLFSRSPNVGFVYFLSIFAGVAAYFESEG